MIPYPPRGWVRLLLSVRGSSSRGVLRRILAFGVFATGVVIADRLGVRVHLPGGVHETTGVLIALVLAFRTNTGYNRFWEGRALWGSIVNTCRNLARVAEVHAKTDPHAARTFATWIVVFAHVTRRRLRNEREWPEVRRLLSDEDLSSLVSAHHPCLHAAKKLSETIAGWRSRDDVDPMMGAYGERLVATLVDNLGGCERILKTPTPLGYVLLMERLIALYLLTLPFMLVTRIETLTPIATVAIAYPILLIDALGAELDDPFGHDASDLPLSRICVTIEKDILGSEPPSEMLYGASVSDQED